MPYLVDSDVLIDISRGKAPAREYIDALPEGWAISQISALELLVGARDNRDLADIDAFLSGYSFVSEVMNEFIVIHPFREGNGRTAFILGDLILMQNSFLPLSEYDQHRHEAAYYAACEAGRLQKNYGPLAGLIAEWEDEAIARWEGTTDEQ
jgi:hypothetical protein